MTRVYGYKKDRFDERDFRRAAIHEEVAAGLPTHFDNIGLEPPVWDQGDMGSCTGNAWAAAFEQVMHGQGLHVFRPSRMAIYYLERELEGTTDQDAGAEIRSGIKVIAKYGVCPETMWPYLDRLLTVKPSPACMGASVKHKGLQYARVNQNASDIRAVIAARDPVVFGFNVYESFEGDEIAKTGIMSMPTSDEKLVGGHAVKIRGYDDHFENLDGSLGAFLVRNSWGKDWGQKGYFWMPYEFALDPAQVTDIWALSKVE